VDQLAAVVKNRLKRIQYRPALISGFLAQTGLTLEPQPRQKTQMLAIRPNESYRVAIRQTRCLVAAGR
jgi:hypothetical protein